MTTSSAARQFVTWASLAAVLILLLPAISAAQPVKSFDQLITRLKPGDRVWVTDAQGREVEGTIQHLSANQLVLDAEGASAFTARDVKLIKEYKGDSVKNGALIGLGIGGGLGLTWCIAPPPPTTISP